jgi:tRNA (guanine10-N2)-dimethyltransferase
VDLLVELSMEHPTLPRAEVEGVLDVLGADPEAVEQDGGVLRLAGIEASAEALAGRLGLAHRVMEPWAPRAGSAGELVEAPGSGPPGSAPPPDASFAVRVRRMGGVGDPERGPELAREVGDALSGRWPVDLDDPDWVFRVLVTGEALHGGRVAAEVDRSAFEERHVEERPLFSPVSLHPRMARAMVNLARVAPGDRVLDPFVGTGGIALEAGLVGGEVLAGDVDPRMVEGVRQVLDRYGVEPAAVREADAGEAGSWAGDVAAMVTDPPYGRAATTDEEERGDLYERFLAASRRALEPGGWLVAAFPEEDDVDRVAEALDLEEVHVQEVHGSLTRHVVVARKPRE